MRYGWLRSDERSHMADTDIARSPNCFVSKVGRSIAKGLNGFGVALGARIGV